MSMPHPDRPSRTVWEFDEHNRRYLNWRRAREGAAVALGMVDDGGQALPPLPPPDYAQSNWTSVVDECLGHYGLKITDVRKNMGRTRLAIDCMQELCYRLVRYGRRRGKPMTYAEIGRILNRDHTTILYNSRVFAERIGARVPRSLSKLGEDQ